MFMSINCICEKILCKAKQSLPHSLKASGSQKLLQPINLLTMTLSLGFHDLWVSVDYKPQAQENTKALTGTPFNVSYYV